MSHYSLDNNLVTRWLDPEENLDNCIEVLRFTIKARGINSPTRRRNHLFHQAQRRGCPSIAIISETSDKTTGSCLVCENDLTRDLE